MILHFTEHFFNRHGNCLGQRIDPVILIFQETFNLLFEIKFSWHLDIVLLLKLNYIWRTNFRIFPQLSHTVFFSIIHQSTRHLESLFSSASYSPRNWMYVAITVLKYLLWTTCNLFSGLFFARGTQFFSSWSSQLKYSENS